LKKNHRAAFDLIEQSLRARHPSEDVTDRNSSPNFFGGGRLDERRKTLESLAQDMYGLLTLFKGDSAVNAMPSFQTLDKVFEERRELVDETVALKDPKKIKGDSVQNPSDPDVGYGHKRQGLHQAQLEQICGKTKDRRDAQSHYAR
jgi:hypothetical protein